MCPKLIISYDQLGAHQLGAQVTFEPTGQAYIAAYPSSSENQATMQHLSPPVMHGFSCLPGVGSSHPAFQQASYTAPQPASGTLPPVVSEPFPMPVEAHAHFEGLGLGLPASDSGNASASFPVDLGFSTNMIDFSGLFGSSSEFHEALVLGLGNTHAGSEWLTAPIEDLLQVSASSTENLGFSSTVG
ncbi:hypothetical protein JB92DRAFT_3127751 [Gautieria morchelliformis]|nr:hypothetical protein JB92DRAFT_3127751 [Gautieria morchelliformis]